MLFYLASAGDLAAGRPVEVCVFTRKALSRVELRVEATAELAVDYSERSPRGARRRRGDIEALKLSIKARPVAADSGEEFELLGLKGDVELYLDPATRIPVQVSGRLPGLGRVHVKLTEVELAG